MKTMKLLRLAFLISGISALGAGAALADDCSGRDHTAGTVLGAAGGAAIGGTASHNAGGAIAGAVIGGLAGNAIDRAQDCDHRQAQERQEYGGRTAYDRRPFQGPGENDYWGVESYADFDN